MYKKNLLLPHFNEKENFSSSYTHAHTYDGYPVQRRLKNRRKRITIYDFNWYHPTRDDERERERERGRSVGKMADLGAQ